MKGRLTRCSNFPTSFHQWSNCLIPEGLDAYFFSGMSRGSRRHLSSLRKSILSRLDVPSVRNSKNHTNPAFVNRLRGYCVLDHGQTRQSTSSLRRQLNFTPLNCDVWNCAVQSGPETGGIRSPRCSNRRARSAFTRTRRRDSASRIRKAGQVSGSLEKGEGKLAAGPRDIHHEPKRGAPLWA